MTKPKMSARPPAVKSPSSDELTQRAKGAEKWAMDAAAPKPDTFPSTGMPWETAHPRVKVGYALRMSEELHMKVQYLTDKMPKTSMHQFIVDAIEEKVDRLLWGMKE